MQMELHPIRYIIYLQFCISTQHPYFHPASLVRQTHFHPASRHFPSSIPAKNTTLVSYLLRHITSWHSMQIAPSRAYFRSGPKLKHIDRCGCHLYYQRFCNGYSAPKSINQCLYITMEIGPYSCFHIWNSHEDGAISIVYIYYYGNRPVSMGS